MALFGSRATVFWRAWSLLIGASCLSVAAGNTDAIVIPRLELILPGIAYGAASAWRLYYRTRKPAWNDRQLLMLSATGFFSTVAFASIELTGTLILTYAPVSDATIALNTTLGDAQPLCSALAVTCWTLVALYRNTRQRSEDVSKARMVALSSVIGLVWATTTYAAGTSTLEGPEKAISCLTGGIICVATALLMQSTGREKQSDGAIRPSSRTEDRDNQEALKKHAKRELSDRELTVLLATIDGKTAKQIAQELSISVATVGSYRARGYEKVGVRRKKELVGLLASHDAEETPSQKDAGDVSEDKADPVPLNSLTALLSCITTMGCLLIYIAYGPVNQWYQSATDDWTLSYWWPVVEGAISSVLLILTVAMTIHNLKSRDHDETLLPLQSLTLSRMSSAALCLSVVAAGFLLAEMTNMFDCLSGCIGLMGLVAALSLIGLASSAGEPRRGLSSLPRYLCLGFNASVVHYPEIFGLFSLAALFWGDVVSYWLTFFPDSWQPIPTACTLLVSLFALMVLARFREAAGEATVLHPNARKRLNNYLLGRGLNELQADVISLTLQGETTDSICTKLSIAPGTVGSYRSRAYATLGVRNLTELRELLIRETHIPS